MVLIAGAGCATSSSARASAGSAAALSAGQLANLVVAPPTPFAHVPDSEKSTGLMEVGNPRAGTIGSPLGTKDQLVASGFQRGWESLYRTPGAAEVVQVEVFEFRSPAGPRQAVDRVRGHLTPGYERIPVPGVAGADGQAGTSPEGRQAVAVTFADGRFAVSVLAGGTQAGFDYRSLALGLAKQQRSRLPSR